MFKNNNLIYLIIFIVKKLRNNYLFIKVIYIFIIYMIRKNNKLGNTPI